MATQNIYQGQSLELSGAGLTGGLLTLTDGGGAVVYGPQAPDSVSAGAANWLTGLAAGTYTASGTLTINGVSEPLPTGFTVAILPVPVTGTQTLTYTPDPSLSPEVWTNLSLLSLTQGTAVLGPFPTTDSAAGAAATSHTLTSTGIPDPADPFSGTDPVTAVYQVDKNGVTATFSVIISLSAAVMADFADLASLRIGLPQFDIVSPLSNQALAGSAAALHILMPALLHDDGTAYIFSSAAPPLFALIDCSRDLLLLPVTSADYQSGDWLVWAGTNPGTYARLFLDSAPGPSLYEVRLIVGSLAFSAGLIVTD